MNAFREALYKAYIEGSSGLFSLLGDSLYAGIAPRNAHFPYGVFGIPSEGEGRTFTSRLPELLLQFDIYADTLDECDSITDAVKKFIEDAQFAVAGYVFVHAEYEGTIRVAEKNGYHNVVQYLVTLHTCI